MYLIKTNLGDIKIETYPDRAPISAENFDQYVQRGFYDGTIFHRVIPNFMIQCGGFTAQMQEKPDQLPAIKNESFNGLTNDKYTLAMARTSLPDSATSQFFINTTNNSFLNEAEARDGVGYAVFGRVIQGQEVVDKISAVPTGQYGPHSNVPVEPVVIHSITPLGKPPA